MSSYKVVDSTISILYCAKCASEVLEVVSPGRLVCPDCGTVSQFDGANLRIGHLVGTKYKQRSKRQYAFREIVDEAREDAFNDVFVPSPEPGRGRTGWRKEQEQEEEAEGGQVKTIGPGPNGDEGWRNELLRGIETIEGDKAHDRSDNAPDGPTC
ncbi:MAG TPA: hypothetical protein VGD99_16040 [Anaerolineae bacterium]